MVPREKKMASPWLDSFVSWNEDTFSGYVKSKIEVNNVIEELENKTNSYFIIHRTKRQYGKELDLKTVSTIHWLDTQISANPGIECDGVPFVIMGSRQMECQHGPNHNEERRKKMNDSKNDDIHNYAVKKRRHIQCTKKLDCGAKIYIRHIVKYPEFKIETNTKKERQIMSSKLKLELQSKDDLLLEHQFHIQLPKDHNNHLEGEIATTVMPIDRRLAKYIHEKTIEESVYSSREMRILLSEFVRSLFEGKKLPSRYNSRYWPTLQQIRNHMVLATMRCRNSSLDQDNLQSMVEHWVEEFPDDKFKIRLKSADDTGSCENDIINLDVPVEDDVELGVTYAGILSKRNKFLYIHQSKIMRDLLIRYGQEINLLDATYRTSKYSLPLFFLAVPTNVHYVVVAYFIIEGEDKDSIKEALSILRQWNPQWRPKYFMTDFSNEEINAVEETFVDIGTLVYLCDFHRVQAWNRWLKASFHKVSQPQKDPLMQLMKAIADSDSKDQLDDNINQLKDNPEWKTNDYLEQWFETKYLKVKERWVKLFREEHFNAVNTNNGVERQNGNLKHGYLWCIGFQKTQTVSQLVHIIVNKYLPESLQRYLKENTKCSSQIKAYNTDIPSFLCDRPSNFVQHVMLRWIEASTMTENIDQVDPCGIFFVGSASNRDLMYEVKFDCGNGSPKCQCPDWKRYHLPCKHMLLVIQSEGNEWTWNHFPEDYRNSPFYTLDLLRLSQPLNCKEEADDVLCVELNVNDQGSDADAEKPQNIKSSSQMSMKCRAVLKEIDALTYLCNDIGALQDTLSNLEKLKSKISSACPKEGPFLAEKKTTQPITVKTNTQKAAKIPLRRSSRTVTKKTEVLSSLDPSYNDVKNDCETKVGTDLPPFRAFIQIHESETFDQLACLLCMDVCSSIVIKIDIWNQWTGGDSRQVLKRKQVTSTKTVSGKKTRIETQGSDSISEIKMTSNVAFRVTDLLDIVQDYLNSLNNETFKELINEAIKTSRFTMDMFSRLGPAVLELFSSSEEEQIQTMKLLCHLAPERIEETSKFRLTNLILGKIVEEGKIKLPLEKDPRVLQDEMDKTMKDMIVDIKNSQKSASYSKTCRVNWADGFATDFTHVDIDNQKAKNKVDHIWNEDLASNYFLAKVYKTDITYGDINSLKVQEWLTDKIVDAYLGYIAQMEMDKGRVKVRHEVVSTVTNILNGNYVTGRNERNKIKPYDYIIGAYHQRSGHWDLLIIEPPKARVVFLNPMGETMLQRRTVLLNWKKYIGQLLMLHPEDDMIKNWSLHIPEHSKQQDGSSCGMFCLMFAEKYINGSTLMGISQAQADAKRRAVASTLMMFEGYMVGCCPCCGFKTNEGKEPLVQCKTCKKIFHKKSHCVGDRIATDITINDFICQLHTN